MKKEIIYSDLDRTLFQKQDNVNSISKPNLKNINKWMKNNYFSVATGRTIKSIEPYLDIIKQHTNLPLVLANGSIVYDQFNDEVLFEDLIDSEIVNEFIKFREQNKGVVNLALSTSRDNYLILNNNEDVPLKFNYYQKALKEDVDITKITKIAVLVDPYDNEDVMKKIMKLESYNLVDIIPSSLVYIEIVNKGISKYSGILNSLKIKNINNYNLYAIGDYTNDIAMLENAKISFAPNNASNRVKSIVNYVVRDNNNHAIFDMINLLELHLK